MAMDNGKEVPLTAPLPRRRRGVRATDDTTSGEAPPLRSPWAAVTAEDQEFLAAELGPEAGATALAVWFRLCLAGFRSGGDCTWVSYRQLARDTRLSLRTVVRRVDDLNALGFVAASHSRNGPASNAPTEFTLLRGHYSRPVAIESTACCHNGNNLLPMCPDRSGNNLLPTCPEPSGNALPRSRQEHSTGHAVAGGRNAGSEADAAQQAAELYDLYPRHVGRRQALRAIAKALRSVPHEILRSAVEDYARAVSQWPPEAQRYVPYPATWFNSERWADDRETWTRGGAAPPAVGGAATTENLPAPRNGDNTIEPGVIRVPKEALWK